MKKYTLLKWIVLVLAIAIDVFILVNAFMDGASSSAESGKVAHQAADIVNDVKPNTVTEENFPDFHMLIRKLFGHFALTGVAGIFNSWAIYLFLKDTKVGFHVWLILLSMGFGFLLSGSSELAQMTAPARGPSWADVGIDYSGYFIGEILVFLIVLCRKSPIFKLENYKKNQA